MRLMGKRSLWIKRSRIKVYWKPNAPFLYREENVMEKTIVIIKKDVENLLDTANLFYKGDEYSGLKAMEEGTKKLLAIVDGVVEITSKDPTKNNLDINYINSALTAILDAYEKKDGVLLADLLTFELLDYVLEVIEQWENKGE